MDNKELLQEILRTPRNTASYSHIRYVSSQMTEEEQVQFLKGLLAKAVESRESGEAGMLWDYLEEWEEKGITLAGQRAKTPEVGATPWAPLRKPLNESKVALVTTGGFYVEDQEPYETDGPEGLGDWSWRAIPRDTPKDKLKLAHIHYDLSGPTEDPNCVLPVDRFTEMERDGIIGQLADTNYSFMGYIERPDLLSNETAPDVARRLKEDGVDAVVLTST